MPYSVYAIYSKIDYRIYVGLSNNVERRVKEHNNGQVKSTKAWIPWVKFYEELVGARKDTREREKYLKSGCGKEFLKSILDSWVAPR